MQISAYSGKARIFINNKWSAWMDRNEAQKLEDKALYGDRPYRGIFLLEDARRLGLLPAGAVHTRKLRGAK